MNDLLVSSLVQPESVDRRLGVARRTLSGLAPQEILNSTAVVLLTRPELDYLLNLIQDQTIDRT